MIMGYAETLRDNSAIDAATRSRFLDQIYTSSVRLNHLINDIIELHRLESVGGDFSLEAPGALSDIATAISALYENSGDGRMLDLDVDSGEVAILDEHLQSILINLIDNAFKYSEGDRVITRVQRESQHVMIRVDDQGPQIECADRERIFERFYTCSKSRNKQHSGTGLGLSIVKHITNLYEGEIRVEENCFGGNRFSVSLYEKSPETD
jgi:two-component system phosphate regulon sensor histidine kinase PhoR